MSLWLIFWAKKWYFFCFIGKFFSKTFASVIRSLFAPSICFPKSFVLQKICPFFKFKNWCLLPLFPSFFLVAKQKELVISYFAYWVAFFTRWLIFFLCSSSKQLSNYMLSFSAYDISTSFFFFWSKFFVGCQATSHFLI